MLSCEPFYFFGLKLYSIFLQGFFLFSSSFVYLPCCHNFCLFALPAIPLFITELLWSVCLFFLIKNLILPIQRKLCSPNLDAGASCLPIGERVMVAEIALALEVQLGLAGLVRPHHGVDEPLTPTEPQAMLEES